MFRMEHKTQTMTSKQISKILHAAKMKTGISIQNYYYNGFEADLLWIKNDFIYEFEIKVSRSDFFKDFEKKDKHELLQAGKMANRFYFVVPTCLVKIAEVPAKYGLIFVNKKGEIKVIKQAKELHKNKADSDLYKKLAKNLMLRLQTAKDKLP